MCCNIKLSSIGIFRCCPICRTEIRCWTTKKFVQLTWNEQRQQNDVSIIDKQRQQKKISLDKQRKKAEVTKILKKKDKRHEILPYKQPKQRVRQYSNRCKTEEVVYQFCRFDSSIKFVKILTSLRDVTDELSFLEILLLLRSNLIMDRCSQHMAGFIKKSCVFHLISGFELIESIIRHILSKAEPFSLTIGSLDVLNRCMPASCLRDVEMAVQFISSVSADVFPCHKDEFLDRKSVIIKIINDINQFFCSPGFCLHNGTCLDLTSDSSSVIPSDASGSKTSNSSSVINS